MGLISSLKTAASKVVKVLANPTGKEDAGVKNILPTVKAALTGQGVTANTGNKTADKVLSAAASNPYATAAVVATLAAPAAALGTAKAIGSAATASTTGKIATVAAVPVAVGFVVSSPKKTTKAIATAPAALSNFGANVGEFVEQPSIEKAKDIVAENPIISAGLLAAGAVAAGKLATGAATSIANTLAVQKNTKVAEKLLETTATTPTYVSDVLAAESNQLIPLSSNKSVSAVPLTPETQVIGKAVTTKSVAKRKRTPLKRYNGGQRQSLRVNIFNQTKSLYRGSAISY